MPTLFVDSASFNNVVVSESFTATSNIFVTGTFTNTAGATGSVFGTSSFTLQTVSSSLVSASNIYGPHDASSVLSSSYSLRANFSQTTESYYTVVGATMDIATSILSGSGVKFTNMVMGAITGNGGSLSSGSIYFAAIYVPASTTVTGLRTITSLASAFTTSSNYNGMGLYSYDGAGTLNIVASSSNSPTIWSTSGGTIIERNFSSLITLSPGPYYIGLLYNRTIQTVAPSLAGTGVTITSTNLATMDFTNSATLYGVASGTYTSLPTSLALSTITTSTSPIYVAIY